MRRTLHILAAVVITIIAGCSGNSPAPVEAQGKSDSLAGTLIIYHAGSLSVPVKQVCDSFISIYPRVKILTESAGSKDCARKISDLGRPCDIFFSADYKVIEDLLEPEHAEWNLRFATNEMALVFTPESRYSVEIDTVNWISILSRGDVIYARSDPASDPCGVRAVFTLQLAEKYYKRPGLAEGMLKRHQKFIRPKETDLIALLETRSVDYIFLYRSVAMQHGLSYISLPPALSLGDTAWSDFYSTASVQTPGKKPGEFISEIGAPMVYGLTIPKEAPNPALAIAFLEFFLSPGGGMKIMEQNGQKTIQPASVRNPEKMPGALIKFTKDD